MQVTSTLGPDIKSQKLSEHRYRLRQTKSDTRTQFRQAKTGQDQRGPDKEAQDSLLDEARVGWPTWQVDRPTGQPTQPMGPTASTSRRGASPLVAEVGCSGSHPWLPAINTKGEGRELEHTHPSHLSSLAHLAQSLGLVEFRRSLGVIESPELLGSFGMGSSLVLSSLL